MTLRAPSIRALANGIFVLALISIARFAQPPHLNAAPPAQTLIPAPTAATAPNGWPSDWQPLALNYFSKSQILHTEIPKRPRRELVTYQVVGGDTVVGIAKNFGVTPESVLWANERLELNPGFLRIGQELIIPPTTGVLHEVKAGDTLESLAKKYNVNESDITSFEFNRLTPPYTLRVGQKVMVPGGEKPFQQKVIYAYSGPIPANAAKGFGRFEWPLRGLLTQGFWTGHRAIDLAIPIGTPVRAADSGFVVLAGEDDSGYGKRIMINHGACFETLYAHLSATYVAPGDSVQRGQIIGLSGNSGRSTGPHLHFEVRCNGVQYNPVSYLPR
jgi:murein DD-endopeptidase MepM/ murein hydrolase activator NlpD